MTIRENKRVGVFCGEMFVYYNCVVDYFPQRDGKLRTVQKTEQNLACYNDKNYCKASFLYLTKIITSQDFASKTTQCSTF